MDMLTLQNPVFATYVIAATLKRDVFRFVRILRWRSSWRILGV